MAQGPTSSFYGDGCEAFSFGEIIPASRTWPMTPDTSPGRNCYESNKK